MVLYDEADLPQLTLYADKAMFYADEEKNITLTVRVPAALPFAPIRILDENGQETASIGEDAPSAQTADHREYTAALTIPPSDPCVTTLTAVMDGAESLPL